MDIANYLATFAAENPTPLAKSPRGTLWRVDTQQGPAVLKVLTDRGLKAGELSGALALRQWKGVGAARLLGLYENAILMEFLSGPTLGEALQSNCLNNSAQIIAELAVKLRRPISSEIDALRFRPLIENFDAALSKADIPSLPAEYRETFKRAKALWHSLIESTQEHCLLHGDLNLDNILQSARGWTAIDPKGLIGDPCYEFAITFRTPFNQPEITASPERIFSLAETYAAHTGFSKQRILQFAFAHVALSLSWHLARGNQPEADLALLQTFDSLGLENRAANT